MKYRKWTLEETRFVREHSDRMSDQEIANALSLVKNEEITRDMVRRQRRNMGTAKKRGRKSPNPIV